jgi:predicted RNA-binding protein YlxR (DUF448 family)
MTAAGRPVLRRCVACRCLVDRRQLWRVIRLAGGGIALDQGMGRSAYLCPDPACLEDARRRKRLQRALRCQIADSIISALAGRLDDHAGADAEAR